jgi:hypothetical protein
MAAKWTKPVAPMKHAMRREFTEAKWMRSATANGKEEKRALDEFVG